MVQIYWYQYHFMNIMAFATLFTWKGKHSKLHQKPTCLDKLAQCALHCTAHPKTQGHDWHSGGDTLGNSPLKNFCALNWFYLGCCHLHVVYLPSLIRSIFYKPKVSAPLLYNYYRVFPLFFSNRDRVLGPESKNTVLYLKHYNPQKI